MTSYADTCWEYLNKRGYITAWVIHTLTGTTCPHDVIRSIRRKHGYDKLTFKDVKKSRTYIEAGKERKETKTFKIWYLAEGKE